MSLVIVEASKSSPNLIIRLFGGWGRLPPHVQRYGQRLIRGGVEGVRAQPNPQYGSDLHEPQDEYDIRFE